MIYKKLFDPSAVKATPRPAFIQPASGDRAGTAPYEYTPDIILAVNVAMATGRPLLVRGSPGSGKSTLAYDVADKLGYRYYSTVVTSRTQAEDLLWKFDALLRLNDARGGSMNGSTGEYARYIEPGVLWWASDRASALERGVKAQPDSEIQSGEPAQLHPNAERAVVLIDEIDKADPDVPNNLLIPLGSFEFWVREGAMAVRVKAAQPPLIFITTNGERELPPAFLRRCIVLDLPDPDVDRLCAIAAAHFGTEQARKHRILAEQTLASARKDAARQTAGASAAEYLDLVRACIGLDIDPNLEEKTWADILKATVVKPAPPSAMARTNN